MFHIKYIINKRCCFVVVALVPILQLSGCCTLCEALELD